MDGLDGRKLKEEIKRQEGEFNDVDEKKRRINPMGKYAGINHQCHKKKGFFCLALQQIRCLEHAI